MLVLVLCALTFLRWPLLHRLLGTKRMYLFDSVLFTVLSAWNFAEPGPWPVVGIAIGVVCAYWAFKASKTYLMFDELIKAANDEQGKTDDESASGS